MISCQFELRVLGLSGGKLGEVHGESDGQRSADAERQHRCCPSPDRGPGAEHLAVGDDVESVESAQ